MQLAVFENLLMAKHVCCVCIFVRVCLYGYRHMNCIFMYWFTCCVFTNVIKCSAEPSALCHPTVSRNSVNLDRQKKKNGCWVLHAMWGMIFLLRGIMWWGGKATGLIRNANGFRATIHNYHDKWKYFIQQQTHSVKHTCGRAKKE